MLTPAQMSAWVRTNWSDQLNEAFVAPLLITSRMNDRSDEVTGEPMQVLTIPEIEQMDDFTLWNDGSDIPVFAWMLNDKPDRKWNLYDLQDRLRMKGWLVPAYPMPVALTQVSVQRIVVRNGFSHDMAEAFIKDLKSCVKYLDGLRSPMPSEARASGFHH